MRVSEKVSKSAGFNDSMLVLEIKRVLVVAGMEGGNSFIIKPWQMILLGLHWQFSGHAEAMSFMAHMPIIMNHTRSIDSLEVEDELSEISVLCSPRCTRAFPVLF